MLMGGFQDVGNRMTGEASCHGALILYDTKGGSTNCDISLLLTSGEGRQKWRAA